MQSEIAPRRVSLLQQQRFLAGEFIQLVIKQNKCITSVEKTENKLSKAFLSSYKEKVLILFWDEEESLNNQVLSGSIFFRWMNKLNFLGFSLDFDRFYLKKSCKFDV